MVPCRYEAEALNKLQLHPGFFDFEDNELHSVLEQEDVDLTTNTCHESVGERTLALAIGVAIDSNVLINERVREELRNGASPQAAIHAGYDRAWGTILDSNVTTLIAGIALLAFGSGPIRGFAVVHCIGIVTSMFSAVFFSRGLVNFWYGRKKKLRSVSIGTVWKPATDTAVAADAK